MWNQHHWLRDLSRYLANPAVGVLTVAALIAFAFYAMVDNEAFARTQGLPMLFGAR